MGKQVDKSHYNFASYVSKGRWASMWHQLDEVLALEPKSVLEIGPGPGIFKALAHVFELKVDTLDLDPDLQPDYVAQADAMPFDSGSYDVVCAFQMLEHVPYEVSLRIFREMSRVGRNRIVISLPDAQQAWPYSIYIPKMGEVKFFIPRPSMGPKEHVFNGEHYWELNKKGYSVDKVANDLAKVGDVVLERTYRVKEYPYHRFFIFHSFKEE